MTMSELPSEILSPAQRRLQSKIALTSGGVWGIVWLVSIPIQGAALAATVGTISALAGAGFGLSLAGVTRTRSTGWIYFFLALAFLSLSVPLSNYPPASEHDLVLPAHAPDLLANYFDFWRWIAFFCAIPFPFARFGHHAPDPVSPSE